MSKPGSSALRNSPVVQTMEKIDQKATGGVGRGVGKGLKSAGEAATTDVVKGVAKAPIDVLKGIIGGSDSDDQGEGGIEDVAAPAGGSQAAGVKGAQMSTQQKMAQAKARDEAKLKALRDRQHKMVQQQETEQYEKTKREEEEGKMQENQEQEHKQEQVRQLQVEKREAVAVTRAKMKGGTGEVGRKKH